MNAGMTIGIAILKNTCAEFAPSTSADSQSSDGTIGKIGKYQNKDRLSEAESVKAG